MISTHLNLLSKLVFDNRVPCQMQSEHARRRVHDSTMCKETFHALLSSLSRRDR